MLYRKRISDLKNGGAMPEDDGYIELAGAIIKEARHDYIYGGAGRRKEVERFFRSQWGDMLCMGQAEYIFKIIKEEAKEYRRNKTRHDVTKSK